MTTTKNSILVSPRTLAVITLFGVVMGCRVARTPRDEAQGQGPVGIERRTRRPNTQAILVLMPRSPAAENVLSGLTQELERDYDLLTRYVDRSTTPARIDQIIRETDPRAIVLMNNPTVRLYRRYQALRRTDNFPPAVVVLTSFIERTSVGLQNFTGIAYEVPLVTSLVNLRALLRQPILKVGVLYRPEFADYIADQRALARVEQFDLQGVEVSGTGPGEIRRALRQLQGADVVWVLNDNVLLRQRSITQGWLPYLERNWLPVVVNVGSLVTSDFDFGTFAVLPDHRALGLQTANVLLDLAAQDWRLRAQRIELPISVQTVLDVGIAQKRLQLNETELARVDRVIR